MPPTIRVDDNVWAALQKEAQPFVDTPNDVLRRLLGLNGVHDTSLLVQSRVKNTSRIRKGEKTPVAQYFIPVLRAIEEMRGRGPVSEILDRVGLTMRNRLNKFDLQTLPSGQLRWRNTAQWARNAMVKDMNPPLLDPSSPNGWWEITDAGREYLRTYS
jgi:hypothetical protein